MGSDFSHVYIYGLRQVGRYEFRYIGQTVNPRHRFMSHLRQPQSIELERWVQSVNGAGCEIEMIILSRHGDLYEAAEAESKSILHYRSLGHRLVNKQIYTGVRPLQHAPRGYKPRQRRMKKQERRAKLMDWIATSESNAVQVSLPI